MNLLFPNPSENWLTYRLKYVDFRNEIKQGGHEAIF